MPSGKLFAQRLIGDGNVVRDTGCSWEKIRRGRGGGGDLQSKEARGLRGETPIPFKVHAGDRRKSCDLGTLVNVRGLTYGCVGGR